MTQRIHSMSQEALNKENPTKHSLAMRSKHTEAVRFRVLQSNEVNDGLVPALEHAGFVVESCVQSMSAVADILPFDCLLVNATQLQPSLVENLEDYHRSFPIVLLLNDTAENLDLSVYREADEFVCLSEIPSWQFKLRLERLVSRFRQPLSYASANSPEAKLLQTVVNHASDWLFIKDLDHRFLAVSEDYANSFDQEFSNVIGKNDLEIGLEPDLVYGTDSSDFEGFWPQDDRTIESGIQSVETNPDWRVFTGDTRHRRTVRAPLKNAWGEPYALLICSEDVTQIVKTEQALRERNDMLESMTASKIKAEKSRVMAELAVTTKNKFIATASHDLRQPLHAMGLYIDVLERKLVGELERSIIARIKTSSNALSVLFNSLLDLSRLDAGVVEVRNTDFPVAGLLNKLLEEMQGLATEKGLTLSLETCDTIVTSDSVLVERVIRNLVHNAITYTSTGSVTVRCRPASGADAIVVDIIDTGPGIPEFEQHSIFSEYHQLENQLERPAIGLGLGLAIVKRLVDLMGMTFTLQSEMGKGTVFSLELPIGDERNIVESPETNIAPVLSGSTILIVDDEQEILDGMYQVLAGFDCKTIVATSVEKAIDALIEIDAVPDMIVADYRLQDGQTGDQAIQRVREEFNVDMPAIIVTGDTSADRLKEATRSGFRLLHKPVNAEELLQVMSELISTS